MNLNGAGRGVVGSNLAKLGSYARSNNISSSLKDSASLRQAEALVKRITANESENQKTSPPQASTKFSNNEARNSKTVIAMKEMR